ncbi:MAG: hypothetical protein LJF04_05545 [Gemmatimonadetes bacterium]|nr:hypothetical protein [Gemmatimonadota bacterium]
MFTRCIFCHKPFPENGRLAHMPRGHQIAYDPERGRLWTVCEGCHRWNLCPMEDRDAALFELERLARDHGKLAAQTANISLLVAGSLTLVRVGHAALAERAWWRYGRELRRRKASYESVRSKVTAATFGAVAYVGGVLGLTDDEVSIDWQDTPVADVLRWRRFGWAAWHGRERCPYCNSTLRALRYELSWWVYPLRGPDGRIGVGVPCQRCDPWTPEKVYELHGDVAENVLRRVLAYQNIMGASERRIVEAARTIEDAGSVGAFAASVTDGRQSLWKMRGPRSVALEIALNEKVERRMLDLEARALEFLWKREEELAYIIDHELTPRRILEAHLRRLPIRLGPRPASALLEDMEIGG